MSARNGAFWTLDGNVLKLLAASALLILVPFLFRSSSDGKVHDLGGIPIVTAWPFFTRRHDFIQGNFKRIRGKMFRFKVLQHRVVAISSDESRRIFFTDQSLSPSEGYRILMGGSPRLKDVDSQAFTEGEDVQADVDNGFVKRSLSLLRSDRVADSLPTLLEDLNDRMVEWGDEGKINPFKHVYDLVLQMTIRMATCRELAEDRKTLDDLAQHYWNLEKSATPVSLLLPWFPGPAKKAKEKSTIALYMLLHSFVDRRRKAPTPSTDAIDLLIAQGDSDETIIGTILGIIFSGVINTGMNTCWALVNLGSNLQWKQRAIKEFQALVQNYTNTLSSEPLHRRLSAIPLNAWDEELPSVDLIIRETLRLTQCGSTLRRNLHNDITIDGVVIKRGDFLTYSLAHVHLNPDIYSQPTEFDPDRYLEGREEDRKETFGYLGWGAGRHPCSGIKIAKLEMKLVLALILLGYEYELVDSSGKKPKSLPLPDRNDIQQARPLGEPCYLKFKHLME